MAEKAKTVPVYVRADDVRWLEAQGQDPAKFVRDLVRKQLDRLKEMHGRPARSDEPE